MDVLSPEVQLSTNRRNELRNKRNQPLRDRLGGFKMDAPVPACCPRERAISQSQGGQQGRPGLISIKAFFHLRVINMAGAVGGREGRNELGEAESN